MAMTTLGTPSDTREEKTYGELTKIIADALNEADSTRNLSPNDIAIITQQNRGGSWSYGVKDVSGTRSMTQQMADDRVISGLAKKYKTAAD